MTDNTYLKRIKDLVERLNYYRDEYYNNNNSLVSDAEYDRFFDELKSLETVTGIILSNSPTITVGYDVVSKLKKVSHKSPLLSMDKTKSYSDLYKFVGKHYYLVMAKADGLTTELIYNKGKLIQASTRGNGEIGEDITHNAKTFKNIPLTIDFDGYLRLVGESVILKKDFEKINSELPIGEKYKTPRNLTSGSVRQLDSKLCAERNVRFYAFGMLEMSNRTFKYKNEQLKELRNLGFDIVLTCLCKEDETLGLEDTVRNMKTRLDQEGFPIDGMVITYSDIAYSKSLGRTGHHYNDGIAYKFEDETELTTLRDIEWSVGKTGQITPVAIFDTVILDGTEVSRASVHNISIMKSLKLGIGDEISIMKANMIIPQIASNNTQSDNIIIPDKCPCCGHKTIQETLNNSTVLKCVNPFCEQQLIGRFSHFVSRDAMNIDGLSDATIEKFIKLNWLKSFEDIYLIHEHKDEIIVMDGFGEKSYNKLIDAINKSKKVKLENFIYALSIPNVGKNSSKLISKHFKGDYDNFYTALIDSFDFSRLPDFGSVTDESIYKWWQDPNENGLRDGVEKYLTFTKEDKKDTKFNSLKGLTFVVTGSIITYKNRDELEKLITDLEGKLSGSVSAKTSYLINNDTTSTSGKNQKAKEVGVKIISEADFNKMIGRNV